MLPNLKHHTAMRRLKPLVLVYLGLIAYPFDSSFAKNGAPKPLNSQERVNKHLSDLDASLQIQRDRALFEQRRAPTPQGEIETIGPQPRSFDVTNGQETNSAAQDLEALERQPSTLSTPENLANSDAQETLQERQRADYERKLYVEELKRRARQTGGTVEVDEKNYLLKYHPK